MEQLITDRSLDDVRELETIRAKITARTATAAERALWLSGTLKGAYNPSDMNRVGRAVREIADYFNAGPGDLRAYLETLGVAYDELYNLGYETPVEVTEKTDWTMTDIPEAADLETYLENVETIRAVLPLPSTLPALPASMLGLNFAGANAIEETLEAAYTAAVALISQKKAYADRAAQNRVYCGQPPCGLVNLQFMR